MKKLHEFFKHCFTEAEKVSNETGHIMSKGIMDIPGLADDKGRAPFAEFPILESASGEIKFRIYFTYEEDLSSDIDSTNSYSALQYYQTPWLRVAFNIGNSDNSAFFRIWKKRKSLPGVVKQIFNIVPGKKLSSSAAVDNFYYLQAAEKEKEITDKIYLSGIIEKLEKFENLMTIRLDSRDFLADIKCDRPELYTRDLIGKYIRDLSELKEELIKYD